MYLQKYIKYKYKYLELQKSLNQQNGGNYKLKLQKQQIIDQFGGTRMLSFFMPTWREIDDYYSERRTNQTKYAKISKLTSGLQQVGLNCAVMDVRGDGLCGIYAITFSHYCAILEYSIHVLSRGMGGYVHTIIPYKGINKDNYDKLNALYVSLIGRNDTANMQKLGEFITNYLENNQINTSTQTTFITIAEIDTFISEFNDTTNEAITSFIDKLITYKVIDTSETHLSDADLAKLQEINIRLANDEDISDLLEDDITYHHVVEEGNVVNSGLTLYIKSLNYKTIWNHIYNNMLDENFRSALYDGAYTDTDKQIEVLYEDIKTRLEELGIRKIEESKNFPIGNTQSLDILSICFSEVLNSIILSFNFENGEYRINGYLPINYMQTATKEERLNIAGHIYDDNLGIIYIINFNGGHYSSFIPYRDDKCESSMRINKQLYSFIRSTQHVFPDIIWN